MASHSPQRARRPQVHPSGQGSLHNLREASRSPPLRSRTQKIQAVPIIPTAMQIFSAANLMQPTSQSQPQQLQSNAAIPINPRRSPPAGQVQRLLPTPPHPLPDPALEGDISSPLPGQHNATNPHYPRPINRTAPPQFLSKYQNLDQDSWQMTDELLEDIARADLQKAQVLQTQVQAQTSPAHTYPGGYVQDQTNSPPKDPNVERIRATERSSPKELDLNLQKRQQPARESPKARDRQPTSPSVPSFNQPPLTPERRGSPLYQSHVSSENHGSPSYGQYPRESPPFLRRASNATMSDGRQPVSLATQTPPLQTFNTRTPDRSLPVQEELEDEPGTTPRNGSTREIWQGTDDVIHTRHIGLSPTPSSDLNPDGYIDGHGHGGKDRNDIGAPGEHDDDSEHRYPDRDRGRPEDDRDHTPRSPTADLPEHPPSQFYPGQNSHVKSSYPLRAQARHSSSDQLGLRSIDPSMFVSDRQILPMGSFEPSQFSEQRRPAQNSSKNPQQYIDHRQSNQRQYEPLEVHPDDIHQYDSAGYLPYYTSRRPDAPIPPTPQSQTAAPTPSPLISGGYDGRGKDLPPFSPVGAIGSPYPFPFNHVRRSIPNRSQPPLTHDANDLSAIQEQFAKQWLIYAHNNQDAISNSTLSPSSTPYPGGGYAPWAYLHTNRTLGRMHDTTSLRSSPSHEPITLPTPPPILGVKKSLRPSKPRKDTPGRKLPPRVESTQPRETSPEPSSSSGESTAGEERFAAVEEGPWVNGTGNAVSSAPDDGGEWIDEEEDEDDLLELEYHPTYVNNVEKRRRRWELGWDNLIQAFQALDKQTDATMILLAAPSHSTKLYSASSRSVRRQPSSVNATSIKEMCVGFNRIASHRRKTRSHTSSLLSRILTPYNSSANGSDSSESREEDLKHALEAALGSLSALGNIYEQREVRWHEEMRRISDDREKVELLLGQVLGDARLQVGTNSTTSSTS